MNDQPNWFNIDNIEKLEDSQNIWWGETRTEVIIALFNLKWNTLIVHLYCGVAYNIRGLKDESNITVDK